MHLHLPGQVNITLGSEGGEGGKGRERGVVTAYHLSARHSHLIKYINLHAYYGLFIPAGTIDQKIH